MQEKLTSIELKNKIKMIYSGDFDGSFICIKDLILTNNTLLVQSQHKISHNCIEINSSSILTVFAKNIFSMRLSIQCWFLCYKGAQAISSLKSIWKAACIEYF